MSQTTSASAAILGKLDDMQKSIAEAIQMQQLMNAEIMKRLDILEAKITVCVSRQQQLSSSDSSDSDD